MKKSLKTRYDWFFSQVKRIKVKKITFLISNLKPFWNLLSLALLYIFAYTQDGITAYILV